MAKNLDKIYFIGLSLELLLNAALLRVLEMNFSN